MRLFGLLVLLLTSSSAWAEGYLCSIFVADNVGPARREVVVEAQKIPMRFDGNPSIRQVASISERLNPDRQWRLADVTEEYGRDGVIGISLMAPDSSAPVLHVAVAKDSPLVSAQSGRGAFFAQMVCELAKR